MVSALAGALLRDVMPCLVGIACNGIILTPHAEPFECLSLLFSAGLENVVARVEGKQQRPAVDVSMETSSMCSGEDF